MFCCEPVLCLRCSRNAVPLGSQLRNAPPRLLCSCGCHLTAAEIQFGGYDCKQGTFQPNSTSERFYEQQNCKVIIDKHWYCWLDLLPPGFPGWSQLWQRSYRPAVHAVCVTNMGRLCGSDRYFSAGKQSGVRSALQQYVTVDFTNCDGFKRRV